MLVNGMAARGHNVTVLSVDVERNAPLNAHYILMENVYEHTFKDEDKTTVFHFSDICTNVFSQTVFYYDLIYRVCDGTFQKAWW